MKPSSKAVMIGCISFFVFLYGNLLFGGLVGSLIPGGDDFINSYFYPLYTAVTLLISLIISCTYLILKKSICFQTKWKKNKLVFRKSGLTELKEKDACCPKDKKMEVEENKK